MFDASQNGEKGERMSAVSVREWLKEIVLFSLTASRLATDSNGKTV